MRTGFIVAGAMAAALTGVAFAQTNGAVPPPDEPGNPTSTPSPTPTSTPDEPGQPIPTPSPTATVTPTPAEVPTPTPEANPTPAATPTPRA